MSRPPDRAPTVREQFGTGGLCAWPHLRRALPPRAGMELRPDLGLGATHREPATRVAGRGTRIVRRVDERAGAGAAFLLGLRQGVGGLLLVGQLRPSWSQSRSPAADPARSPERSRAQLKSSNQMAAIENPPTTTINRPVMIVPTLVMMSMGTSRGRYRQIPSGTPPTPPWSRLHEGIRDPLRVDPIQYILVEGLPGVGSSISRIAHMVLASWAIAMAISGSSSPRST